MKLIFCKKDFDFFSDIYFKKGKYYSVVEDSSESCLVIVESDMGLPYSSHRFYYKTYFDYYDRVPIFERYFDNIKEIRKKKILKINGSHL